MKYLKISMMILICSYFFVEVLAFADDTVPISGSVNVSMFESDDTSTRTKINNESQRFRISSANCEDCQFNATPVNLINGQQGGTYQAVENIEVGQTVTLDTQACHTGTWYVKVIRFDFGAIKRTVAYTYDPNAMFW